MLRKTILGLFAVVFLILVSVLTAYNRGSKSISPAQSTTHETPTTPTAITPIVWSPDMDCAICHVMQPYVDSMQDSNLMGYVHAQKGFVCLNCHEQGVLEEVHRGANSNATAIKERKFSKEFCLGCHGSYAALTALTKDSTELTAVADEAVNPHDSHLGEVDCYYCHKMHKEFKPINYCYDCH